MYFPESDTPFYRVTMFSNYSPIQRAESRPPVVTHGGGQ